MYRFLGRRGAGWVHTAGSGNRWCHDSGHLRSGRMPSLLLKLFRLSSCRSRFHHRLVPKCCWVISPARSSPGSERMPMRPRKLDHSRLVILTELLEVMGNYRRVLFYKRFLLFPFQPKNIWILTPLAAAVSPSLKWSRVRSCCPSPAGSMPGTPRCGTRIFCSASMIVSKSSSRKSQSSSFCRKKKIWFLPETLLIWVEVHWDLTSCNTDGVVSSLKGVI